MMNQRQATVNVLLSVLNESGIEYELNGPTPISNVLQPYHKEQARTILCTMFCTGKIQYRPEFQIKVDDDQQIKSYVNGLINNWIRKAREFNSGNKYEPSNPGSRAGSSDPQIRELKKLLAKVRGTPNEAKVQAAIDTRLAAIKPEVEINEAMIPANLRELL